MLIAHLTDLHVRPVGVPAYRVAETNRLTERAIEAVRRLHPAPDAVIVTGDLTDCGLVAEYELLRAMLGRLAMPVYLVPGNHDRRENLKVVLGDFPGMEQHPQLVRYVIEEHPVRLVALDSVVPGAGHGALDTDSLGWLHQTLALAPERPTIVFLHHPPFDCGIGHMDSIRLREGAEHLEKVLHAHPQVARLLCGHHHRPIQALFGGRLAMVGPSVAHQVLLDLGQPSRSAFVMEPPAYHLHRWNEATGLVSHMAYVEDHDGPYPFLPDPDYPGKA